MKILATALAASVLLASCAAPQAAGDSVTDPFAVDRWATPDRVAEGVAADYLRLTLEAGTYEEGYIDAYYGPEDAKSEAETERRPREDLVREAQAMVRAIDHFLERPDLAATNPEPAYSPRRRLIALRGALVAAETRLRMVGGERLSFADEANGLFGCGPSRCR